MGTDVEVYFAAHGRFGTMGTGAFRSDSRRQVGLFTWVGFLFLYVRMDHPCPARMDMPYNKYSTRVIALMYAMSYSYYYT